ncbi:MAG: UDP-N-acetylmuramate--L-alanine ligase [Halanaerobiales bacterium]
MKDFRRVHFIGIGGISMSGIAEILLEKGYLVTGSDLNDSHLLDTLRERGAEINIGHDESNVEGADLVVISSAIPATNPELIYARKNRIPIYKRAEIIAEFMKEQKGIAISGTHGKTTTTSMTATILLEGGQEPTILVGGELNIIKGNYYLGNGDYLVTEADESDGSFLYYHPEVVVVTNVELDHQDYYDSEEKLFNTFRQFLDKTPESGRSIVCAEDETLMELVDHEDKRVVSYGIEKGDIQARACKYYPFGSIYQLYIEGKWIGEVNLQVPGRHNILNSLAAIAIADHIDMNRQQIIKGIEKYSGVHRRFEKKGLLGDILIIDDYAHHPTEVEATLKTAKNAGYERLLAVFQPHRYTRTKHLMNSFDESFKMVDHLIVTNIYSAGEKKIPGVNAEDMAKSIAMKSDCPVDYIAELDDVVKYLSRVVRSRDLIITLGAGDVYRVGELLLDTIKKNREMA